MTGRRLAILGYRKLGEPAAGSNTPYVSRRIFHAQLTVLSEEGWSFVNLHSVLAALAGETTLASKSALVTIDGAHRSLLEHAVPVLREFGCPAVAFVPTERIGRRTLFERRASGNGSSDICDWHDLARLEDGGVSVQSYGASARAFSKLSVDELRAEIGSSKAMIERCLDRPVDLLAYPHDDSGTDPDLTADLLEEAGYAAACLYGTGPFDPWQVDRFRLERIAVGPDTDLIAALE